MSRTLITLAIFSLVLTPLLAPLVGPHFYESQDGVAHLQRVAAYKQAFWEGQFPPRWAGNLASGLGSPVLSFNFPLPYILTTPLYASGLSAVVSLKIVLAAATLLSGLAAYLWLRSFLGAIAATVGAVAWVWAPYKLLNLYHRGAVGEVVATLFLPLLLYAYHLLHRYPHRRGIVGIPLALLILSHNVLALIGTTIFFFYVFMASRRPIPFVALLHEVFIGLGLSAFFWVPAVIESSTSHISGLLKSAYLANFPPWQSILYSPWGGGAMSFQLGIIHWTVFALCIFFARGKNRLFLFGFLATIGSLILTQPVAIPLYKIVPLVSNVLYPWRFLNSALLGVALLTGLLLDKRRVFFSAALITLFILANRNHLGVNALQVEKSSISGIIPFTADTDGEFLPRWADRDTVKKLRIPIAPSLLLNNPAGTVQFRDERGHTITASVETTESSTVIINRFYWPGWTAWVNGDKRTLSPDESLGGRMSLSIPSGKSDLTITLKNTPIRSFGNSLALLTLAILGTSWVRNGILNKRA